jgi:acyl-homoserine lactone acylase PvdQ
VAWSHTVSTAWRFTPYQLTLVPGHPTEYLQNGQPVPMLSRKVTVVVLMRTPRRLRIPTLIFVSKIRPRRRAI